MDSKENSVTQLIIDISTANSAYRKGTPIISDTEYDDKVDRLKSVIRNDQFDSIMRRMTEIDGKVKHPYIMGSLSKLKAFDNDFPISNWIDHNVAENSIEDGIFVSSKIDGCSARLTYVGGKLVGASTRGNGEYGVDILQKVRFFVKNELERPFSGDIRGEITLTKESLEELSRKTGKEYKNLRNATAGLINSKDATNDEISCLRFFPYEIMGNTMMSKREQFKRLRIIGFTTALFYEFTHVHSKEITSEENGLDKKLLEIYNRFLAEAPYDIDGLVISEITDKSVFEDCFYPKNTVAVKFNQMTAESKLIDVVWNVSKSGRLSPVGIIEPVDVGGSTISNVTLNNIHIMKGMGVKYGCTVNVLKSGDVIPKIVGVRHPDTNNEVEIDYPSICPSCGHKLFYEEDALFPVCTNKECDGIVFRKILHFLRKLEIKHVSLKTIEKFGIRSIGDLISLKPDDGLVKKTFCEDIDKLMFGASRKKLLGAFDYDGVSTNIIDKMIEHYGFEALLNSSYDELLKNLPYGVGKRFASIFYSGFEKIKGDYEKIVSDSRYHGDSNDGELKALERQRGALYGKSFVVTGMLSTMSRDGFKKCVKENGGTYQSSISKRTSYLVCNDVSAATSKIKKAETYGTNVIDETKFLNMLKEGADGFAIF